MASSSQILSPATGIPFQAVLAEGNSAKKQKVERGSLSLPKDLQQQWLNRLVERKTELESKSVRLSNKITELMLHQALLAQSQENDLDAEIRKSQKTIMELELTLPSLAAQAKESFDRLVAKISQPMPMDQDQNGSVSMEVEQDNPDQFLAIIRQNKKLIVAEQAILKEKIEKKQNSLTNAMLSAQISAAQNELNADDERIYALISEIEFLKKPVQLVSEKEDEEESVGPSSSQVDSFQVLSSSQLGQKRKVPSNTTALEIAQMKEIQDESIPVGASSSSSSISAAMSAASYSISAAAAAAAASLNQIIERQQPPIAAPSSPSKAAAATNTDKKQEIVASIEEVVKRKRGRPRKVQSGDASSSSTSKIDKVEQYQPPINTVPVVPVEKIMSLDDKYALLKLLVQLKKSDASINEFIGKLEELSKQESFDINQSFDGWTALLIAIHLHGSSRLVKALWKFNPSTKVYVGDGDWGPFELTCYQNKILILKFLINQGVEITKRRNSKFRPIHVAANSGEDPEIIRLLHQCGVDLNDVDSEQNSPMHYGIFNNSDPQMLQALIDCKADPNIPGWEGRVPLHYAAQEGLAEHTKLLLNYSKTYFHAKDIHGNNALAFAQHSTAEGKDKVISILKTKKSQGSHKFEINLNKEMNK